MYGHVFRLIRRQTGRYSPAKWPRSPAGTGALARATSEVLAGDGETKMLFTAVALRTQLACLYVLMLGSGCVTSSSTDGAGGSAQSTGGSAPSACHEERTAFVDALLAGSVCERDDDCTFYQAPCLGVESGNCAGLFYLNDSTVEAIDNLKAGYESCWGQGCGAGGVCGLGPRVPKCVDKKCQ